MALLVKDPETRLWRTDLKDGHIIYALTSNDVTKPSKHDPEIGVMDTAELAETVVSAHNALIMKFGRHYLKVLVE